MVRRESLVLPAIVLYSGAGPDVAMYACGFPVISGSVTPMRGVTENVPASGCAWSAMAAMKDMIVVSMMVFLIVVFVVLLCRSHVESRVADVVLCRTAHLQK